MLESARIHDGRSKLCKHANVEIRHQVFVSSTYVDLVEERQAIIQAVLELDCIPAGMELFVATDEDQWELIRKVIDLSDYYLVVVGARYGHVTPGEISYTEKEYNYAIQTEKPIIAFVHADPDSVAVNKTDKDAEKSKKLEAFRKRIREGSDGKRRNVGDFTTADVLAAKVSRALSNAIRKYPGTGWVRGDQAMTVETQQELIDLKQKITTLESAKLAAEKSLVEEVEELAQGTQEITLTLYISDSSYPVAQRQDTFYVRATTTWDAMFKSIGPAMIDEATEDNVRDRLKRHLWSTTCISEGDVKTIRHLEYSISHGLIDSSWDVAQLQLRSLNLIDTGTKRREVKDNNKYLGLTQKGQRHLMRLRAIKKGIDPGKDNESDVHDDAEDDSVNK